MSFLIPFVCNLVSTSPHRLDCLCTPQFHLLGRSDANLGIQSRRSTSTAVSRLHTPRSKPVHIRSLCSDAHGAWSQRGKMTPVPAPNKIHSLPGTSSVASHSGPFAYLRGREPASGRRPYACRTPMDPEVADAQSWSTISSQPVRDPTRPSCPRSRRCTCTRTPRLPARPTPLRRRRRTDRRVRRMCGGAYISRRSSRAC